MLNTLTNALKRVLSPDLQAQYRAGLINSDSSLTSKGKEELLEILAQEKTAQLTARANEIITEAEKETNN